LWPVCARGGGAAVSFAASEDNGIPCFFRAVPTSITIHCKVPAYHRDDFCAAFPELVLTYFQVLCAASRRGISPVGKCVDEDFAYACIMSSICQRDHMAVMAMNTTVGNQTE